MIYHHYLLFLSPRFLSSHSLSALSQCLSLYLFRSFSCSPVSISFVLSLTLPYLSLIFSFIHFPSHHLAHNFLICLYFSTLRDSHKEWQYKPDGSQIGITYDGRAALYSSVLLDFDSVPSNSMLPTRGTYVCAFSYSDNIHFSFYHLPK